MRNKLGQVLSSSFSQDVINQRDAGNDRLPGLVEGLQAVRAGEKRTIAVSADSAYGVYDPGLVVELRRSDLEYSDRLAPGVRILLAHGPNAEPRLFRVIDLDEETVLIDGNHPLAGQDLVFEVEIESAREAQIGELLDPSPLTGTRLMH